MFDRRNFRPVTLANHHRSGFCASYLRGEIASRRVEWLCPCSDGDRDVFARVSIRLARVRCATESAHLSRAALAHNTMSDNRVSQRRRAGRPPAGAREGERVKDYPQLSIRVPLEMKARLNALSAVTGLAQWRVIVEAIDCFLHDLPPTDRALVDGLSERLMRAG
jgi:predicted DNA-binding protein